MFSKCIIVQHYAARNGKESICALLLERGANVNAQTHGGATPLLRAASQGHKNVVLLLLNYKADSSICDSDGKTPLHKVNNVYDDSNYFTLGNSHKSRQSLILKLTIQLFRFSYEINTLNQIIKKKLSWSFLKFQ